MTTPNPPARQETQFTLYCQGCGKSYIQMPANAPLICCVDCGGTWFRNREPGDVDMPFSGSMEPREPS